MISFIQSSWKTETKKMRQNIRTIKIFSNPSKDVQRDLHSSKLILKYKSNIKKTGQIITEAIGKEKCNWHRFPTKVVVDKRSITNIDSIAENFNKFFTEIGPNLANK